MNAKHSNLRPGWALFFAITIFSGRACADEHARLNFVACPIVRDTQTVPCWLAEHEGELFYLGIQTDVSADFKPPYLGHRVLVEGIRNDDRQICGGIVLEPVRISAMPELDPSCNTEWPAEDRYVIDFNPRPPGPSGGRLAYDAPLPQETGAPAPEHTDVPRPYQPKTFTMTFDVDRSIAFRHPFDLEDIVDYANRVSATRIEVNGNRGSTLLSDGTVVTERAMTGKRRAEDVARLLRDYGLQVEIRVNWSEEPVVPDGVDDWRSRSVDVRVVP